MKRLSQRLGDLPALQALAERLKGEGEERIIMIQEEPEERQVRRRVYVPDPHHSRHREKGK